MAQMTEPHYGADAVYDDENAETPTSRLSGALGGVAALALIAGIGFWGTELVMRDVSGIPVVRAAAGEMRIAPNDPGGQISDQSGLAVNQIAAGNGAAAAEDRLQLAPESTGLSDEDQPVGTAPGVMADAGGASQVARANLDLPGLAGANADAAISAETQALVDQIMADAVPGAADAQAPVAAETQLASAAGQVPVVQVIPASVPGVSRALRPMLRPASLTRAGAGASLASSSGSNGALAAPATRSTEVATVQTYPVGTVMAQLGAYNSAEIAAQEWDRFQTLFGPYMAGKSRVIQETTRAGRRLYRLRVARFADVEGARRFCAAFTSGGAECIAVRHK